MPEEEIPIDIEPRRYKWIEFGDGVDGKILASSSDGVKRIMLLEIDTKILNELTATGRLKRSEIIGESEDRIRVEIPEEYCHDMLYLTCNPKVRADCDFKGNPIPGITNKYMTALKMERDNSRTLQLQILDLQRQLREATSDIERYIRKNWSVLSKPILEDLKPFQQRFIPSTKLRKRSLEPI